MLREFESGVVKAGGHTHAGVLTALDTDLLREFGEPDRRRVAETPELEMQAWGEARRKERKRERKEKKKM